jgi:hypothetical protein
MERWKLTLIQDTPEKAVFSDGAFTIEIFPSDTWRVIDPKGGSYTGGGALSLFLIND